MKRHSISSIRHMSAEGTRDGFQMKSAIQVKQPLAQVFGTDTSPADAPYDFDIFSPQYLAPAPNYMTSDKTSEARSALDSAPKSASGFRKSLIGEPYKKQMLHVG